MQTPTIRPRHPALAFDQSIPRYWFGGSSAATLIANGVNLLFPAGERFFVRSVRHYLDRIDDPVLREQIKGFAGQEGRHAQAHERFFEVLTAQGYDIDAFLRTYERIAFGMVEPRAPAALRLSVTAALEHFTAIMAGNALSLGLLDGAHPEMRKLLLWHASEEIEHKAVAFDVLKKVNPSYALRMAGLAVATTMLSGFWMAATWMLLRQDGVSLSTLHRELRAMGDRSPVGRRVFGRGIAEYARRDFHPADNDNFELARAFLSRAEMT